MAKPVICFGEVLWDLLPGGAVPGGAPMNVASQLVNLGVGAAMISAVGNDDEGQRLRSFLRSEQVNTDLVQTHPTLPTGRVLVQLAAGGIPTYDIVHPVAWDEIGFEEKAAAQVETAAALVYGSLAARHTASAGTLHRLLGKAPLRVFDVNLRTPWYQRQQTEILLHSADLLKLNDEEVGVLAGWRGFSGSQEAALHFLKETYSLRNVLLTRGADGAALLGDSGFYEHNGYRVQVADTIGSGDAFLAGFLRQYLRGAPPQECLSFACATGALAATFAGGTPAITPEMVHDLMNYN